MEDKQGRLRACISSLSLHRDVPLHLRLDVHVASQLFINQATSVCACLRLACPTSPPPLISGAYAELIWSEMMNRGWKKEDRRRETRRK